MEDAIFKLQVSGWPWIHPETRLLKTVAELEEKKWRILVLTSGELHYLKGMRVRCDYLVIPGNCPSDILINLSADHVVTYGLSPRDTLTLSSLACPVLCLQRSLPRLDGTILEPQEFPLPEMPFPAEEMLPVLGVWLLQMPLNGTTLL